MLIRDRLPAYITWDRFEANQDAARRQPQLAGDARRRGTGRRCWPGWSAAGGAGGGWWCGTRGRAKPHVVHLHARVGRLRRAAVPGPVERAALDALVAGQLLAAVEPAALEASLAAVAGVERQRAELTRQWQLRRERAAYEADRAARQYQACEPENRLVARELERRWEEALKAAAAARRRVRPVAAERPRPSLSDDARVIDPRAGGRPAGGVVGGDHHARRTASGSPGCCWSGWSSPWTRRASGWTWRCTGSAARSRPHTITRPVTRYEPAVGLPAAGRAAAGVVTGRLNSAAIAERLNAEGFRPPKRTSRFTGEMVRRLTAQLGLAPSSGTGVAGLGPRRVPPGRIGPAPGRAGTRCAAGYGAGWVHSRRDNDGQGIIWADADEIRAFTRAV